MIKGMSMTWEQAQAEIDLFRKIFEEVRLLSAEEVGSNEAIESEEEKLTQMCQCKSCSEQRAVNTDVSQQRCLWKRIRKPNWNISEVICMRSLPGMWKLTANHM